MINLKEFPLWINTSRRAMQLKSYAYKNPLCTIAVQMKLVETDRQAGGQAAGEAERKLQSVTYLLRVLCLN